ncbi:hypothetical protein [Streptomyces ochraceiscleroticus]|uniref:Zinc-finger domain-containing protein n=1 Tax=Streptomyces ochraceiscleroticus TaxID=47761 RepID=A0ABW1MP99_9ACTN|nr:hypothetical protein [Streptomyces ochraceiscleroticus]
MAGPMSALCQAVRSQATELLLLGRPLPAALTRHLAGCEECAAECEGVRRVVRTFERAEGAPARLPAPGLLPLPSAVPAPAPRPRPRRARRVALLAAAAVLAVLAVLVPVAVHDRDSGPVDVVTVAREGLMIPHPWGTEVPVSLSGLTPGRTYRMMTADADGHRMPAGSLTAPGPGARTRMMTAMARDAIKSLLVEDQDGRLVADLPVRPLRSPGPTADGTATG